MNSLSILAIKNSPVNVNFKSNHNRHGVEFKDIKLNGLGEDVRVNGSTAVIAGSAIIPGLGQAVLGEDKKAGMFVAANWLSFGIMAAGIAKITKAVVNKSQPVKSRIGKSALGAAIVAAGLASDGINRLLSVRSTVKALAKQSIEDADARHNAPKVSDEAVEMNTSEIRRHLKSEAEDNRG